MAKKKKEGDPEEEKNDQFDDNEDFGLPDLEYEELDEDDDLDIGDVDDIDTEEIEDWERELEKELDEELEAGGGEGDEELFYEEESYDDFNDDSVDAASVEDTAKSSVFSTDTMDEEESFAQDDYGKPVKTTTTQTSDYGSGGGQRYVQTYDTGDSGSKGKFARIVVIGTLLFAVIAIVIWLVKPSVTKTPKEPVAEKKNPSTVVETPPDTVKVEEKPVIEEPVKPKPVAKKPQPNHPMNPGEITVLEHRTGKSYVIVGSFFDGDLAQDYSKILADQGKSPMIIPPFKNYYFYRVAIAEFDKFKDAEASMEPFREEYGQEVWPLRY